MRRLLPAGLLLVAACSSPAAPAPAPVPDESWLGMEPGDVRTFDGPAGELVLIFVDQTYDIDGTYASALTWELDGSYTTDYVVEDDSGDLWWYGRKGSWRAGRHGEEPRLVLDAGAGDRPVVVAFDDLGVTFERGEGPVRIEVAAVDGPGAEVYQ